MDLPACLGDLRSATDAVQVIGRVGPPDMLLDVGTMRSLHAFEGGIAFVSEDLVDRANTIRALGVAIARVVLEKGFVGDQQRGHAQTLDEAARPDGVGDARNRVRPMIARAFTGSYGHVKTYALQGPASSDGGSEPSSDADEAGGALSFSKRVAT